MTSNTIPAAPRFWGMPTRYTVALDGSTKLYATSDGDTRTVTTLRSVTDKDGAKSIANDLNQLTALADLGHEFSKHLPELVRQLATGLAMSAGVLSNLNDEADDTKGTVLRLSQVLDMPAPNPQAASDPTLWRAGPLLRLLAVAAAEPDATRRALTNELRTILEPLDGPVVQAEYEADGWYNIAPWIDSLEVDQLRYLLLQDDCEHDGLCWELLGVWSNPGGLLEDHADRIENDSDFRLLVNHTDVVRRLAATRPHLLGEIYSDEVLADMLEDVDHLKEAAELAAKLLGNATA